MVLKLRDRLSIRFVNTRPLIDNAELRTAFDLGKRHGNRGYGDLAC
jgi:hypothetical protein